MVDLPGCYSLMPHSEEEAVARNFIYFAQPDAVVVVCDAVCLERNINLLLQVMEVNRNVIVCVNLMDEAAKKGIRIDLDMISAKLGIPVVGITARSKEGLEDIFKALDEILPKGTENKKNMVKELVNKEVIKYPMELEAAVKRLSSVLESDTRMKNIKNDMSWISIRLLDNSEGMLNMLQSEMGLGTGELEKLNKTLQTVLEELEKAGCGRERIGDLITESYIHRAESICEGAVSYEKTGYDRKDRSMDKFFTGRLTGFPIMFLMLLGVFWITITGANIPSEFLAKWLFKGEQYLLQAAVWAGLPEVFYSPLIFGVYRVLAWVVSVMLPPMAIFFPVFNLLEDFGYLPRVAFNLDRCFKKSCACGKQALTMCMVNENLLFKNKANKQILFPSYLSF